MPSQAEEADVPWPAAESWEKPVLDSLHPDAPEWVFENMMHQNVKGTLERAALMEALHRTGDIPEGFRPSFQSSIRQDPPLLFHEEHQEYTDQSPIQELQGRTQRLQEEEEAQRQAEEQAAAERAAAQEAARQQSKSGWKHGWVKGQRR